MVPGKATKSLENTFPLLISLFQSNFPRPLNLQQQPTVRFRNLRYKCLEDARDVSPAPGLVGGNASSATAQRGVVAT